MKGNLKRKPDSYTPEKRQIMTGAPGLAAVGKSKKVIVEFPEELLERTEAAASELSTDRSKFIRSAVEKALARLERRKLERELADAYTANANLALRITEEFSHVDGEDL